MHSRPFKKVLQGSIVLAALVPIAVNSQSLGSLLNTLKQVTSSNTMDALKSVADVIQGQLPPGASAQNAEGKVVLYRTSWCGYCKSASAYMQRKNVPFVERDIEANAAFKAEYKGLGGNGSVPLIVFGQKTMYGFTEESFDKNYAESRNALSASPRTGAIQGPEPQREIGAALQAGQPMVGKIPGIKVYAQPNRSADKLMLLSKSDEVIYMGEERDGLYRVTTQKGEGWVDKLLVKKL
ncbi:hypothetical protein CSQ96_27595 [Janthinobacterium sp. BJB412]|nr:hypothetical protein CSQ96_27595 [Janthinobacterium sp. BJB412]